MPTSLLLALLLLAAPGLVAAQTGAKSRFVIRRGADTVATEELDRTDTELHGTLAIRGVKGSESYRAVVAPDATIALIEVTVREGADTGGVKAHVAQTTRIIFRNDSVAVDDVTGHGLDTRILPTQQGAVPYLNLSFGLLEQAIRRAAVLGKDSARVAFFNLSGSRSQGGGATVVGTVTRVAADSVTLDLGSVEFRLQIDPQGRLISGGIPAQRLSIERQ
ncbi:MAG TPA: hypothetical protein VE091_03770 [Gemmatimonadales bacterium]|jgi:hypothetical protein|nr:hypothetical protein [Gemmatimonadales bacterium]